VSPLYPTKRTSSGTSGKSALCQELPSFAFDLEGRIYLPPCLSIS